MKIYTARGDKGETSLLFGGRVKKNDLRIECLGDLDELSSFLGLAQAVIKKSSLKSLIANLQKDIYLISSELATKTENLNKLPKRFSQERLLWLEDQIDKLASQVKFKEECFFVRGVNFSSSLLDICRAVCRRSERKVISLNQELKIKNPSIIPYLNRLSSLLFALEKFLEKN